MQWKRFSEAFWFHEGSKIYMALIANNVHLLMNQRFTVFPCYPSVYNCIFIIFLNCVGGKLVFRCQYFYLLTLYWSNFIDINSFKSHYYVIRKYVCNGNTFSTWTYKRIVKCSRHIAVQADAKVYWVLINSNNTYLGSFTKIVLQLWLCIICFTCSCFFVPL